MMQSVLKKLNERKGITLIFALLALLVVTLLSTTLISASLTSAHRLNDDRDSRQASIALDCAANFVRTEFPKAAYYTYDATPSEDAGSHGETPTVVPDSYSEGLFGRALENLCEGYDVFRDYEIKVSSMPAVSISFERKVTSSDTLFYATLAVSDDGTASDKRSMILEFLCGNLEGSVEVDSKTYSQTTHFCTFNKAQKESK